MLPETVDVHDDMNFSAERPILQLYMSLPL